MSEVDVLPEPSTRQPEFVTLADAIAAEVEWLESDDMPTLYNIGDEFSQHLKFGEGQLITVGGASGGGKSCLLAQWVINAVAADPALRAVISNIDVPSKRFAQRLLAHVAEVNSEVLHWKDFGHDRKGEIVSRLKEAQDVFHATASRIAYLQRPVTVEGLKHAAIAFDATILVADYVQELSICGAVCVDALVNVKSVMRGLRNLRDSGYTVFAASQVSEHWQPRGGRTVTFRDSSEIVAQSDDAFILDTSDSTNDDGTRNASLYSKKSRYGAPARLSLRFDGAVQRFDVTAGGDSDAKQ